MRIRNPGVRFAVSGAVVLLGLGVLVSPAMALPPGYVYEMVSPPYKNGGTTYSNTGAATGGYVSPDGDRVAFMSATAFADAVGSGLRIGYVATRGTTSWATHSITPLFRSVFTGGGDGTQTMASTDDLTKSLVFTNADPVTHELQPRRNLYLNDHIAGTYRLLTPDPVAGALNYIPSRTSVGGVLRGWTPSLSHVYIGTTAQLTPDSVGVSGTKLYVVDAATGTPTMVNRTPLGATVPAPTGSVAGAPNHHKDNVISDDGNVVYMNTSAGVYRRDIAAGETVLVNAPEGTAAPATDANALFMDASSDGRYVFFKSEHGLIPTDTNGGADIYRYDADAPAGSRLTVVSTDEEPADGSPGIGSSARSIAATDPGDRLYFVTSNGQQLVAGADAGASPQKIFRWDEAAGLSYVGSSPIPLSPSQSYATQTAERNAWKSVSPNGDYLALEGFGECATTICVGTKQQVYLYDATDSTVTDPDFACVSCMPGQPDAPWAGTMGLPEALTTVWRSPLSVSNDGAVLFGTPSPLLPTDLNGPGRDYTPLVGSTPGSSPESYDAYVYREGRLDLVSTGRSAGNSFPYGISADGETIAFATLDQLSGWDVDARHDVYVARLGGGLPEPPRKPPVCVADECQGQPSSWTVPGAVVGSDLVRGGSGATVLPRAALSLRRIGVAQRSRLARTGRLAIVVKVNRRGRVRIVARARLGKRTRIVARGSRVASRAGRVRVRLRLSPAARKRLSAAGRLRVSVRARLATASRTQRIVLVRKSSRSATAGREVGR